MNDREMKILGVGVIIGMLLAAFTWFLGGKVGIALSYLPNAVALCIMLIIFVLAGLGILLMNKSEK